MRTGCHGPRLRPSRIRARTTGIAARTGISTSIGTPGPTVHGFPPPCTAAELAVVMSGVTFDTSVYLTTHPDVNDFFTSLKGQPKDAIGAQAQQYLDANPAVREDLQRIRQPSTDFRNRCGLPPTP